MRCVLGFGFMHSMYASRLIRMPMLANAKIPEWHGINSIYAISGSSHASRITGVMQTIMVINTIY